MFSLENDQRRHGSLDMIRKHFTERKAKYDDTSIEWFINQSINHTDSSIEESSQPDQEQIPSKTWKQRHYVL